MNAYVMRILGLTILLACGARAGEVLKPGEIRPAGWLRDWCETAREGYLGHLDDIDRHFRIAWTTNCMRRGKLLGWPDQQNGSWSAEGGAYWFDGLVQFAWQMDDAALKGYVSNRLDTVLSRMHPNAIGFLHWMDRRDPAQIREVESVDEAWIGWAGAIFGRSIANYYRATGDVRARNALVWAFNDPRTFEFGNGRPVPGGAWEAYRLTGDASVAAALDAWCAQGPRFKDVIWRYARAPEPGKVTLKRFKGDWRAQHGVLACETALTAFRLGGWPKGDPRWRDSVFAWSDFLQANCLQPHGVPVADESWGFAGADRASETCTVAADLRLHEEFLAALGKGAFGDRIEWMFYNAAAACTTADYRRHAYMQTPNRTVVENRTDTMCPAVARFYLDKHWPLCCTAALTRQIPDFVQHAWLRTEKGLAVALYAPTTVSAELDGVRVEIRETTDYPFRETVALDVMPEKPVAFTLRLRVPAWSAAPRLAVNGEACAVAPVDGFCAVERTWRKGDRVELAFPMQPRLLRGVDRNEGDPGRAWCSVLAGPLLFALPLPGFSPNIIRHGTETAYALDPETVLATAALARRAMPARWSWETAAAPVVLSVDTDKGRRELVPYGAAPLRVSMFNVSETKAK